MRRCRGAGTVEILVASTAALLVLAACTRTMLAHYELWRRQESLTRLREGARRLNDVLAREIRNAGYDPLPGGPFDGRADAVSVAASGRIELLADRRGEDPADPPDGAADPASDERIGFARSATQVHETVGGLAVPLLDGLVVPAEGLAFRYFDACGAELVPGASGLDPAGRSRIRTVRLRLEILAPDDRGRIETETTVALRNRQELACES